jgi:hypothetical protein
MSGAERGGRNSGRRDGVKTTSIKSHVFVPQMQTILKNVRPA